MKDMIGGEIIYSMQVIASDEILNAFEQGKRSVLLVSQPQQGKTGVCLRTIDRFINDIRADQHIKHGADTWFRGQNKRVFYIVNLSDNQVMGQTDGRIELAALAEYVTTMHPTSSTTTQREPLPSGKVLIVIDECHYALRKNGPIHKLLSSWGIEYGKNPATWTNKDAYVLSVSATPYAHCIKQIKDSAYFHIVPLRTEEGDGYYSLRHAKEAGRLKQSHHILQKGQPTAFLSMILDQFLDDCQRDGNGFFVIRATGQDNIRAIRKFVEEQYGNDIAVEGFSTDTEMNDSKISRLENTLCLPLASITRPKVVLIRGSMRAGKTLRTTRNIRGWYESPTSKSDTKVQSLRPLGYAKDGHSKFDDTFPIYCNMKEVDEETGFYDEVLSRANPSIIPSGNNNKPSVKECHDYVQILFDTKPEIADVMKACETMGIPFPTNKTRVTCLTNSNQTVWPLGKKLIKNEGYHTRQESDLMVIHVDGPSNVFKEDWNLILSERPHFIGKFVVVLDRGLKKETGNGTIYKKCMLHEDNHHDPEH